ncbi:helix-turn-helix transcriptional regulator [Zhongshania aquimaris]|uniref:LuxR C-terminal-related transcriptional regulator n=1 Tax=Zhongshania aquimaris TaxID=2857107 RepID=A0ABS6VVQ3_9GAMM|nr:LuxR C-terminal-related transcriptional regulator [Zhongshania aquimaris]MBW2942393.1 LuxR C-terminal-related transcriptional regulator [Zhongshania aquimaris]
MTDIIETKLNPPYIRQKRMSRSAIARRTAQEVDSMHFVSVVAPAGSGKSTLLVELHENYRLQGYTCSWLNLEPGDDDPVRFARYIVSALRVVDRSFAERSLEYLKSNTSADLRAFFDSIIQFVAAIDVRLALFIDDFHVLKNSEILQFWTQFISYAPENLRIVIASRAKLPLDLSRLRIAGGIFEVSQSDLNLSVQETMQFMKEQHNVELPMHAVQLLHDRTEGWMVGLQLAGMTISKSDRNKEDIIRGFSARDRDLQEYLFEAVYGLQDDATRYFLLRTAPLNRFSAALCNVVTGGSDGQERLAQLEAANLFIIPLDREGHWYRYHHLFSEYLLTQLQRNEPVQKQEICERAADWCIGEGLVLEAIQYCLDAAYFEKATDLIAEHAKSVAIGEGNHSIIFEWMKKLPKEYQYRRPEILLHHAWSRAFTRDGVGIAVAICEEFESLLADASASAWDLNAEEMQSFVHLCNVIRCITLACFEDVDACVSASIAVLKALPRNEFMLVASASVASAYCHYLQQNFDLALSAASDAYVFGRKGESAYAAVWGDFVASLSNVELGRVQAAEASASRAEQTVSEVLGGGQAAALAALAQAEVDCQRCNFEQLEQALIDGRVISTISNSPEPLLIARRCEARYRLWLGEYAAACRVLQEGQDIALTLDMPRLYFAFIAEEVELQLHCGDVAGARGTARRTDILNRENALIDTRQQSAVVECIDLTEVRIHLAEKRAEEALKLINHLLGKAQRDGRLALVQQLRTMKSLALWMLLREAEAVRELDQVVSAATTEVQMYPLYRVGPRLLPILKQLQSKQIGVAADTAKHAKHQFVRRLTSLLGGAEDESAEAALQSSVSPLGLVEPLTGRQLEILRLIGTGLGNKELAETLHISLSTVKWHVHNIIEKLGVKNRTAAVSYARINNLI